MHLQSGLSQPNGWFILTPRLLKLALLSIKVTPRTRQSIAGLEKNYFQSRLITAINTNPLTRKTIDKAVA